MSKKYYISNIDHEIHNISDRYLGNIVIDNDKNTVAFLDSDDIEIDVCTLHTLEELLDIFK